MSTIGNNSVNDTTPTTPIQLGALFIRQFPNLVGLILCIYLIWGSQQQCEVQRIYLTNQLSSLQQQYNKLQ